MKMNDKVIYTHENGKHEITTICTEYGNVRAIRVNDGVIENKLITFYDYDIPNNIKPITK